MDPSGGGSAPVHLGCRINSRSIIPLLLWEGRLDCPAPCSARPLRPGEAVYHGVHGAPLSTFMVPRSVFTMRRSSRSRWAETLRLALLLCTTMVMAPPRGPVYCVRSRHR